MTKYQIPRRLGWVVALLLCVGLATGVGLAQGPFPAAIQLALQQLGLWPYGIYSDTEVPVWDAALNKFVPGSGGGGGGGTPSAPVDSVQFNNAGSFGGSANFTWDGSTLMVKRGGTISGSSAATGYFESIPTGDSNAFNVLEPYGEVSAGRTINYPHALYSYMYVAGTSTIAYGFENTLDLAATAVVTQTAYPMNAITYLANGVTFTGSATIELAGLWVDINTGGALNTGLSGYASIYLSGPQFSATGATTTYGVYLADNDGGAQANKYYFWADAQGVYRIKHDNVADTASFPQAIPALYNPRFTKYTPGAANYERGVDQWVNNVYQVGTQAGGTGTQRVLQLLGSSVNAVGNLTAANLSGTNTGDQSLAAYVTGPASAVDNAIARFDGTTGKIIQDYTSGAPTISDTGGMTLVQTLTSTLGTITASTPVLSATQTWNASGTTFVGLRLNATNTASASGSLLLDLQLSSATVLSVRRDGWLVTAFGIGANAYYTSSGGQAAAAGTAIGITNAWQVTNGFVVGGNVGLVSGGSAILQMGVDTNGAAVSQQLQAANGITGTDRTGGNFTLASGKGTGAGAVSSLIFQTPTVLASGTTAQSLATRFTLSSAGGSLVGYLELVEQTAPTAPAANGVRIYAVDNGAGKTQLMAIFASGVAQQLAIEP